MAFDTSGNFTRPLGSETWQADAAAGTRIKADLHDNHDNDLAGALTECLNRNGKGGALADISWNGFHLTNLADAVNPTDAINKRQVEAIRSFSTGIIISGADASGRIAFSGLGETGLSWSPNGDMFFGVDVVNQWWIWNDKADATGNNVMELNKSGTLTQMYKADGAGGGPTHDLYRDKISTTGGVTGDVLGLINFSGKDSTNARTNFAYIYGYIEKADNNLEGGGVVINRMVDGVMTQALATTKDGVNVPQKLSVASDATVNGTAILPTIHHNSAGTWFTVTGGDANLYHQFTTGYYWVFTPGAGTLSYASDNVMTFKLDYKGPGHFYKGCTFDDATTFVANYDATNKYLQFEANNYWRYEKATGALAYVHGGTTPFYIAAGAVAMPATPSAAAGMYFNAAHTHYVGPSGGHETHQFMSGYQWFMDTSTGDLSWIGAGAWRAVFYQNGQFTIASSTATKATAGQWAANSDRRIKNLLGDYTRGLAEVLQIQPRRFALKADPDQREHVGMVAQEIEDILPDTITRVEGEIDGAKVPDMRQFDPTNIMYALVNAVKELSAKLDAANERIAALEAA